MFYFSLFNYFILFYFTLFSFFIFFFLFFFKNSFLRVFLIIELFNSFIFLFFSSTGFFYFDHSSQIFILNVLLSSILEAVIFLTLYFVIKKSIFFS